MTEGKRDIIRGLLSEYDIKTTKDIQEALRDLLGGTIKEMMEAEMSTHLGYEKSERSESDDYRNGYKPKTVDSSYGEVEIQVPQDRKATFEPQIVKKGQRDISDIDRKIISMYAKGMTTRQNRPLDSVYPVVYIDAIHYSVRDSGVIKKMAAYVILALTCEGRKEVLSLTVGDNESAKYWLNVLNELKNRGVKDIMIICSDGLAGIKEAIAAAFPKTEY
jgi:Transposase and inactivated derivatives